MARPLDFVLTEIIRVAEELDVPVERLTRDQFINYSDNPTEVTKRDLERLGGFGKLRLDAMHRFVGARHSRDNSVARGVEIRNHENGKEERKKYTADYFSNRLLTAFDELLQRHPVKLCVYSGQKDSFKTSNPPSKYINLLWSDLHFGVDVHSNEVLGASYNWEIAANRMSQLVDAAIVRYREAEMAGYVPKFRVVLNGDILHGIIHLSDAHIKPITEQVHGALTLLSAAISTLDNHSISGVDVHCLPGNHDRMNYRGPERALSQRWDSYSSLLYIALKHALAPLESVYVDIPLSGISFINDLNGSSIVCSHGDTAPHIGNVSKSLNTEHMMVSAMKLSQGLNAKVSAFLFGHWHTPTVQMLPTGQYVVVNGSLIGSDTYSQNAVGYFNSMPAQIMFDSTEGVSPIHNIEIIQVLTSKKTSVVLPVPFLPNSF